MPITEHDVRREFKYDTGIEASRSIYVFLDPAHIRSKEIEKVIDYVRWLEGKVIEYKVKENRGL